LPGKIRKKEKLFYAKKVPKLPDLTFFIYIYFHPSDGLPVTHTVAEVLINRFEQGPEG
jgi:hypothetical protein